MTRAPRERGQLLALHSDLSSVPVSPSCQRTTVLGRVVTHPAAVVLTVRTLFLRREEWDHNPPAITTRNSYWRRRQDSNLRVKSQWVSNPSCPVLFPDMCPHIYGTTAVCLSVMLSCLFCPMRCTNIQALRESSQEVCILTSRVVTLCSWFHCLGVLVEIDLYYQKNWG